MTKRVLPDIKKTGLAKPAIAGRELHNILQPESSDKVLDEVKTILTLISPEFDFTRVVTAYITTTDIFLGRFNGYRSCNTKYHDFIHTAGTFLAMARIIHGAVLAGMAFSQREAGLGLVAALLHDTGYIQERHDTEGTGAKYTENHVDRSMDFLSRHSRDFGLSENETRDCADMILGTEISKDVSEISFTTPKIGILARMLAVSDIISQMSDRIYLEKLLFLYHEFMEGNVGGYKNEIDFLRKTIGFYDLILTRLETLLENRDYYLKLHFSARWNVDENLYRIAMDKNRKYLKKIIKVPDNELFNHLKRAGIVDKVNKANNDSVSK